MKPRRSSMPDGFLGRITRGGVGEGARDDTAAAAPPATAPARPSMAPAPAAARGRFSLYLPSDLIERMRNAVDAMSGPPHRLTLNGLAGDALLQAVEDLEARHNDGKPFPQRPGNLRTSRLS